MSLRQATAGRVAFLARREAIWAELAKGWSVSSVHRQFAAEVPIGLRQFQIYVKRYLIEKSLPRFVAMSEVSRDTAPVALRTPPSPTPQPAPPGSETPPQGFHRISKPTSSDLY